MLSGSAAPWQRNLLWQGQANIVNAIAKTIKEGASISDKAKKGLCAFTKAVYSFSESSLKTNPASRVYVAIPGATGAEKDAKCLTDATINCLAANYPPFLETNLEPQRVAGHDLSINSLAVQVCA